MGILNRIFGKGSQPAPGATETPISECAHLTLVPRWDNAEDMGKAEKVTSYLCEGCKTTMTPEEAERVRAQGGV